VLRVLRGRRIRHIAGQVVFLAVVAAALAWLRNNLLANLSQAGIDTSYHFLRQPAGFDIGGSSFRSSETVGAALLVALRNTIAVSAAGIVLATSLGLLVGIARLSPNWLLRRVAGLYVETLRNVPVLVTIVFLYQAIALRLPAIEHPLEPLGVAVVSNRGVWIPWVAAARSLGGLAAAVGVGIVLAAAVASRLRRRRERGMGAGGLWGGSIVVVALVAGWAASGASVSVPHLTGRVVEGGFRLQTELAALLGGLVLYTSSHIAEIVRASILAVPRGQSEAAEALGLTTPQRLRLVVVPQALRIMIPPLANQYLNLTKNSSLGVAIAFPELTSVVRIVIASGSPAPQAVSVLIAAYLTLSLTIAAAMNLFNRRLLATWRSA
jgi:general L-amino acid transport system permease protein